MPFMPGVIYAVSPLNAYIAFATSVRRLLLILVDLPPKENDWIVNKHIRLRVRIM